MIESPLTQAIGLIDVLGQPYHGLGEHIPGQPATIHTKFNAVEVAAIPTVGNTRAVTLSGLSLQRTSDDLTMDAARNYEWRSDAILNGSSKNNDLQGAYFGADRWLYHASTGAVWELLIGREYGGTFQARLFETIGATDNSWHNTTVSGLPDGWQITYTYNIRFEDVRRDCKKALISINKGTLGFDIYELSMDDNGTIDGISLSAALIASAGVSSTEFNEEYGAFPANSFDETGMICTPATSQRTSARSQHTITKTFYGARYSRAGAIQIFEDMVTDIWQWQQTYNYTACSTEAQSPSNSIYLSRTHNYSILLNGNSIYDDEEIAINHSRELNCGGVGSYHAESNLGYRSLAINSSASYDTSFCYFGTVSTPCDYGDTPGYMFYELDGVGDDLFHDGVQHTTIASYDPNKTGIEKNICTETTSGGIQGLAYCGIKTTEPGIWGVSAGSALVRQYQVRILRQKTNNVWALQLETPGAESALIWITPDGITTPMSGSSGDQASWNPITGDLAVRPYPCCWY